MNNLRVRKSLDGTIRLDYGGRGLYPRWTFQRLGERTEEGGHLLSELVKGLNLRCGQTKRVKLVEVPDETPPS